MLNDKRTNMVMSAPLRDASGYGERARDVFRVLAQSGRFNMFASATTWGGASAAWLSEDMAKSLADAEERKMRQEEPFMFLQVSVASEFQAVSPWGNIGVTAGLEADSIPGTWVEACNRMTLVVVPTLFVKEQFTRCGVTVPVAVAWEGVDARVYNPDAPPLTTLPLETARNFLVAGEWVGPRALGDRKGIGLAISCFLEAFDGRDDVGLVVKTSTTSRSTVDQDWTLRKVAEVRESMRRTGLPRVYLVHGTLTAREMAGLYTHPTMAALLSTTSGEGWGRTIAEAAACDLPVIATGWSGHMDYMDPKLSTALKYKLVPVPEYTMQLMRGVFLPGMNWAEPDARDVVKQLKKTDKSAWHRTTARKRAAELGRVMRSKFSTAACDRMLLDAVLSSIKAAA